LTGCTVIAFTFSEAVAEKTGAAAQVITPVFATMANKALLAPALIAYVTAFVAATVPTVFVPETVLAVNLVVVHTGSPSSNTVTVTVKADEFAAPVFDATTVKVLVLFEPVVLSKSGAAAYATTPVAAFIVNRALSVPPSA
jgi:hypothetical protein